MEATRCGPRRSCVATTGVAARMVVELLAWPGLGLITLASAPDGSSADGAAAVERK